MKKEIQAINTVQLDNLIVTAKDIRDYRDSLNMAQLRFGVRYGKSDKTISAIEKGRIKNIPAKMFIDVVKFNNERHNHVRR